MIYFVIDLLFTLMVILMLSGLVSLRPTLGMVIFLFAYCLIYGYLFAVLTTKYPQSSQVQVEEVSQFHSSVTLLASSSQSSSSSEEGVLVSSSSSSLSVVRTGESLYHTCAACHGKSGEKKAFGRSEKIQGWPKEKTLKALIAYQKGERNVHGNGGMMQGQISRFSEGELKELAAYISTL